MKRPTLFANLAGMTACMIAMFCLAARAQAGHSGCGATVIYCAQNCTAVIEWDQPHPCCTQVDGSCCVRNCYNYFCEGPQCQSGSGGVWGNTGAMSPFKCTDNPDCVQLPGR